MWLAASRAFIGERGENGTGWAYFEAWKMNG